jgi:16S rRNA C967 or C1407 C5-methylase (RsmB/RsmF family)/NOL1/NOP2/fmu family ribosome biogenesis protein
VNQNRRVHHHAVPIDRSEIQTRVKDNLGRFGQPPLGLPAFVETLFQRHPNALRLRHGLAADQVPFELQRIPWYSAGYRAADERARPTRTLSYAGGDFYVQDAGSMLALAACNADQDAGSPRLICDLCAAPGGKASALLESIGRGFLLANEPIKSRIAPLAYNLARTGSDRYAISAMDPQRLADRLEGLFDLVLVDAPCSGQALLSRGKQQLAAFSEKQVEHSAARARRILTAAMRLLRVGGKLVFSTCTFAEAENESQVRWMLSQAAMTPSPVGRLAEYESDDSGCCYRLWPQLHHCAGSFAASLQKDAAFHAINAAAEESLQADARQANRERRRGKKSRNASARKTSSGNTSSIEFCDEVFDWFDSRPSRLTVKGAVAWAWPGDAPEWVETVSIAGPELAYRTGRTWKPAHGAALRCDAEVKPVESVDVGDAAAKAYLRGEPIATGDRGVSDEHQRRATRGWCVVRHAGRSLGWIKVSGNIAKNHLPAAARLDCD